MITLYQFDRTWGIPNLSPFCCKVETYLRIAGIDYAVESAFPLRAPKGKLPYIHDRGQLLADSRFIIDYLKTNYMDLDADLNPQQLAVSMAMQRLVEEHLFWVALYSRWQYTDANWQVNKQAIFGKLPIIARDLVASGWRIRIKKQILGHGISRHQPEEIFQLGCQDVDTLANFLGNKIYFMGDHPTSLDACIFGLLVNITHCPIESPLKEYCLSKNNLIDYVQRMMCEYFSHIIPSTN